MSSALFVAIGAGVAVLTGIGAGIGIGKATAAAPARKTDLRDRRLRRRQVFADFGNPVQRAEQRT